MDKPQSATPNTCMKDKTCHVVAYIYLHNLDVRKREEHDKQEQSIGTKIIETHIERFRYFAGEVFCCLECIDKITLPKIQQR